MKLKRKKAKELPVDLGNGTMMGSHGEPMSLTFDSQWHPGIIVVDPPRTMTLRTNLIADEDITVRVKDKKKYEKRSLKKRKSIQSSFRAWWTRTFR